MPISKNDPAAPSPNQVQPTPVINVGSYLEAESFFKSSYYQDSYYFPWNPDPLCRGNNYKTYEEMSDDDQIKVALSFKMDVILNSGWSIECAPRPDIAEFVTNSLKKMEDEGSLDMSFEDCLRDMLSSYRFGFALAEPVFRVKGGFYEYDSIRVRPQQSFRFKVDDYGTVQEIVQMTSRGEKNFSPALFVHHVYQPEYGNPYGKSDLRAVHNPWRAKKFVTKFLAIYLERFASPTVIGRYPSAWDSDQIARLDAVIKNIQQTTSLTAEEGAMIEFVQANKDSSEVYIKALHYYNMHIARGLLVPDLLGISGEKTGGGSYSLGQDQFKIFLATVEKDRLSLARKLSLRLIQPLVRANFGQDVECEFKFTPYSMDDNVELMKVWADIAKGKVFKPNPEEINYLRKQLKFPEGPVVEADVAAPVQYIPGQEPSPGPGIPQDPLGAPTNPAQPLYQGFAARRPITGIEKKVDFAAIAKTLDAAESDLSRRLKASATQVWKDLVDQIKSKGLIRNFQPEKMAALKPRFLKDMNLELKHGFRDLLRQAIQEAHRELFPDAKPKKFALDDGELEYEDMIEVLDAEAFNIPADYSGLASKKVNSAIAKGLKQGMSESEIIAAIREDMPDITETWANTLLRTKTTEIYNRGRKSYFDNDELAQQFVEGYQFSAILDLRTTDVCRWMDQRVFNADDDNINLITPPLHFNCRSVLVPVTRFEKSDMEDAEPVPTRDILQGRGANLLSSLAGIRSHEFCPTGPGGGVDPSCGSGGGGEYSGGGRPAGMPKRTALRMHDALVEGGGLDSVTAAKVISNLGKARPNQDDLHDALVKSGVSKERLDEVKKGQADWHSKPSNWGKYGR